MTRTLLIPGIDGSPDPHWQAWWQKNDPMALTVHQDDWTKPSPEAWEAEVAGAVLQNPGAILVAHSLGCLVVARLKSRRSSRLLRPRRASSAPLRGEVL
ncbi:MAG: alpha/beta hydrolase [Paracoccaceae bacterium]